MRIAFYCIILIYDDSESSMDPVLLKKDNKLCHGRKFDLKISVVIVDGETILANGTQSILWNKN
jgi:hypothetical protein